jgi:hypothetical protein
LSSILAPKIDDLKGWSGLSSAPRLAQDEVRIAGTASAGDRPNHIGRPRSQFFALDDERGRLPNLYPTLTRGL